MSRDTYCTKVPVINATATDRNIPNITDKAFSVFIMSPSESIPVSSPTIRIIANINVPPNNSNTIDTVVDVGSPNVLKMSSRTTSVTITASRMHMMS